MPSSYLRELPPDPAPSISIVTPSFQQGRFLERTLYSVISQDYPALEYIVQDGASTDNTLEVLRRFEPLITSWASKPDSGQAEALNRAFQRTTGEIMAWLNSDDLLLPGSLSYVARYFAEHPEVDVVYSHRVIIDEDDGEIGVWILPAHDDRCLTLSDYVPQETLFWRRRIWESVGAALDPSFRFALDWDLLLRFRDAGARMVRLPRFLGAFRVHADQKTAVEDAVGRIESDRLRQRANGRPLSIEEVLVELRPYLVRHLLVHTRQRIVDHLPRARERVRTIPLDERLRTNVASAHTVASDLTDVAVVGLWHLGSVSTAAWTATGRRVRAWDPDPDLRSAVAAARGPVVEPGLDDALRSAADRGLVTIVDDPAQAMAKACITHLAYDTRVTESGHVDDPRLDEGVQTFAAQAPDGALLLVSSQLAVGTCRVWRDLLAKQDRGLLLAYAPENLRLGNALEGCLNPERLLVGADDDEAFARAAEMLAPFSDRPLRMGLASAEMAKHATNAYLGLCVAFANDLAWLSQHAGADPHEVAAALRADSRVSPSAPLRPGSAFSGATLARDLVVLRELGERFGRPELFAAVLDANERHSRLALAWLEELLGSLSGTRLAVAGLTYKPGTSTLRDSLSLRLVSELLERGATVTAWDPGAERFEAPSGVTRAGSLEACVREADALAVMTALPQLQAVDWRRLRPARRLLVDACMAVDRDAAVAAGWVYRGLAGRVAI